MIFVATAAPSAPNSGQAGCFCEGSSVGLGGVARRRGVRRGSGGRGRLKARSLATCRRDTRAPDAALTVYA